MTSTLTPEKMAQLTALLNEALLAQPVNAEPAASVGDSAHDSIASAAKGSAPTPIRADKSRRVLQSERTDWSTGVIKSGWDALTAWPLILLTIGLCGLVYWFAPAKLLTMAFGITKLCMFAFGGALVDYLLFPNDAPEDLTGIEQGTAWKRRGLIVAASILSGGWLT